MPQLLPTFHVMPVGWEYSGWRTVFYPDDLPNEWRLSYFANEFSEVLLPQPSWEGIDEDRLLTWMDDVSGNFRFFLGISEPPAVSDYLHPIEILGKNLGGFVLFGEVAGSNWREALVSVCRKRNIDVFKAAKFSFEESSPLSLMAGEMRLAILFADNYCRNIRAMREFFDNLRDVVPHGAHILLCFPGDPPAIDTILKLRQLAQLMDLA